jgi:hypothetical protein
VEQEEYHKKPHAGCGKKSNEKYQLINMKTKHFVILCLCLTILAIKTAFADDVPDQTIASWTAVYTKDAGFGEIVTNKIQYTLSTSGEKLVIVSERDGSISTSRVAVSKIKNITEWPADYNDRLGLDIECKESFSEDPPTDDPSSTLWIYFSKTDSVTHDLVKKKLNDFMGK